MKKSVSSVDCSSHAKKDNVKTLLRLVDVNNERKYSMKKHSTLSSGSGTDHLLCLSDESVALNEAHFNVKLSI